MTKRWKATVAVATTITATAVAGLVAAPPANAAARCYGTTCDGKPPVAQGCTDDSRVLATADSDITRVGYAQLGFSRACNAAWVRQVGGNTGSTCSVVQVQRGIYDVQHDTYIVQQTRTVDIGDYDCHHYGAARSLMVNAAGGFAAVRMRVKFDGWSTTQWFRAGRALAE